MGISKFYGSIRERIGNDLLLVPAVAAVVRDSHGHILVHQRPDGTWSLPAGAIEPGETPAQAVVRETLEETGLEVVPDRISGVVGGQSCRVRNGIGHEIEYLVIVFHCSVLGGTLRASGDETTAVSFLPEADVNANVVFPLPTAVYEAGAESAFFQQRVR
jgi:8-oxo-dGTP pyrophosphatase MutT (NUDIX family)